MAKPNVTAVEAVRRARTLWPEFTLSCDYEAETLPLLFAPDSDFAAYFDALEALHHRKARLIHHVRLDNIEARKCRADGDWPGCIAALEKACTEREAVFCFDDYQCVAARIHLAWTAVHAATIVSVGRETADDAADAHIMFGMARAIVGRVFGSAAVQRETALSPQHTPVAAPCRRWLQRRVSLVLHCNWANHWASRKRWAAAMQHSTIAANLANTLMPHYPRGVTEPIKVSLPTAEGTDSHAEAEVEIPPPPAELFSDEQSTAWENPQPVVMILEARRLICEAIQRSTGTAALSGPEGRAVLSKVLSLCRQTASVTPVEPAEEKPVLEAPRVPSPDDDSQPCAWALIASDPAVLQWTLTTAHPTGASPCLSVRATVSAVSTMAAAFLHLHLRSVGKARECVARCAAFLSSAPGHQPSEWAASVHKMSRCVEIAGEVSLVEKRTMPRTATRQAQGLTMATLVRDELDAAKAASKRLQRERAWQSWAVQHDETGMLEDGEVDPTALRSAFQLPPTKKEANTIAARISTPSVSDNRAATPGVASSSVPPPFARASTPFGAYRSNRALEPACDLRVAADVAMPKSQSSPVSPNTSAASPSVADTQQPRPAAASLAAVPAPKRHRNKEADQRRKHLRSLLPTLDIHGLAYREVVRELAALEASEREAREAAARDELLAKASRVASKAGMAAMWRKTKAAKRLAEATAQPAPE